MRPPGQPGKGLSRDPDPDKEMEADRQPSAASAGRPADAEHPGSSWAQVWDVNTTGMSPRVPVAGAAASVLRDRDQCDAAAGLACRSALYGPLLNAAAVLLTATETCRPSGPPG